jgi:hypothetical protein
MEKTKKLKKKKKFANASDKVIMIINPQQKSGFEIEQLLRLERIIDLRYRESLLKKHNYALRESASLLLRLLHTSSPRLEFGRPLRLRPGIIRPRLSRTWRLYDRDKLNSNVEDSRPHGLPGCWCSWCCWCSRCCSALSAILVDDSARNIQSSPSKSIGMPRYTAILAALHSGSVVHFNSSAASKLIQSHEVIVRQ